VQNYTTVYMEVTAKTETIEKSERGELEPSYGTMAIEIVDTTTPIQYTYTNYQDEETTIWDRGYNFINDWAVMLPDDSDAGDYIEDRYVRYYEIVAGMYYSYENYEWGESEDFFSGDLSEEGVAIDFDALYRQYEIDEVYFYVQVGHDYATWWYDQAEVTYIGHISGPSRHLTWPDYVVEWAPFDNYGDDPRDYDYYSPNPYPREYRGLPALKPYQNVPVPFTVDEDGRAIVPGHISATGWPYTGFQTTDTVESPYNGRFYYPSCPANYIYDRYGGYGSDDDPARQIYPSLEQALAQEGDGNASVTIGYYPRNGDWAYGYKNCNLCPPDTVGVFWWPVLWLTSEVYKNPWPTITGRPDEVDVQLNFHYPDDYILRVSYRPGLKPVAQDNEVWDWTEFYTEQWNATEDELSEESPFGPDLIQLGEIPTNLRLPYDGQTAITDDWDEDGWVDWPQEDYLYDVVSLLIRVYPGGYEVVKQVSTPSNYTSPPDEFVEYLKNIKYGGFN